MLKIFYWSPFLSKIATVSSITRSIESIQKYNKKKLDISIIDSVGEWSGIKDKIPNVKIIKLYKNSLYNRLPKKGFFQSRLTLLFIYFFSFFKLLNLLKNKKPDYIIVHLLVSLPLILMTFLNGNTKLILRISGLPRLNIIRKNYLPLSILSFNADNASKSPSVVFSLESLMLLTALEVLDAVVFAFLASTSPQTLV